MSGMPLLFIALLVLQNPDDARTMCGTVQSYVVSPACETVLIGGSGGSPTFTILIPPAARRHFDRPPQTTYLFQGVCATGLDGPKREGLYSIVIKDPSQLRVGQRKEAPTCSPPSCSPAATCRRATLRLRRRQERRAW